MALNNTNISYVDKTWNPFGGCTPVSPGCANCYARELAETRLEKNPTMTKYREGFKFEFHPKNFDDPIRGRKAYSILVNSMSDTFHEEAPLEIIQRIFDTMVKSPRHTFLILTKRAERMADLSAKLPWPDNVWAGITVENADCLYRLDYLRQVLAKVRFVSFEPLLSPIPNINFQDIHWAIVGGESGDDPRPMSLDWARGIRDQCLGAKVPFYFKQVGGKGHGKGGNLLDGREWNEFPNEVAMAITVSGSPGDDQGDSSDRTSADGQSERYVERYPIIMKFSRDNPHPILEKIRVKEVDEMPKEKKSDAGADQSTVKKGSEDVQKTLSAKEEDTTPAQPGSVVGMVDESKLIAVVDEIRQRRTIRDDRGNEIDFTDDLKTSLVSDVESAYPVLAFALANIYETGKFLFEVRARQKKNRLWMSFQEIVGMGKTATNDYIRVYEGFADRLPEFGHLGVSKLQVVARLKEPVAFLEAHKDEVETENVRSVAKMVRTEVEAKRKHRDKKETKKESRLLDVGSYRIEVSKNGRLLKIHNLNKEMRERLIEHLKEFLSQGK